MTAWMFLRVDFSKPALFGPDHAAVLEAIQRYGSIAAAYEAVGSTYWRTWIFVKEMNRHLGQVVVVSRGRHGGASLTPLGQKLLKRYRRMEGDFYQAFAKELRYFQRLVGDELQGPKRTPRYAQVREPKRLKSAEANQRETHRSSSVGTPPRLVALNATRKRNVSMRGQR